MWRKRFLDQGLMGLYEESKPGGPRLISDEQVARLIRKALNKKPKNGTHCTCRSIAKEAKLSKSTVHRVWNAFGIQPHRQKHFKLSTDPFFVEKVRDIVGLYLNPPDKAMVLCVKVLLGQNTSLIYTSIRLFSEIPVKHCFPAT